MATQQEIRQSKEQAGEILRQLGGYRFIAMTGAKNFWCDKNTMGFKLPGTLTKSRINHIKITLTVWDTYNIEFISIWGDSFKIVSTKEGIYCDMLRDIIEDETGLRLSL